MEKNYKIRVNKFFDTNQIEKQKIDTKPCNAVLQKTSLKLFVLREDFNDVKNGKYVFTVVEFLV